MWLPFSRQDGVRLWEYIPLAVPAMLLVLVLPAWETTVWLICWTFVFLWVPWDMPPYVVYRVFYPYECPPKPYPPSTYCSDPGVCSKKVCAQPPPPPSLFGYH